MHDIKKELYDYCAAFVEERIKATEHAIISAKEAATNDTKSSAGDKYETTREMMQQEISRNQAQLLEANKLKHALGQFNPVKVTNTAQPGSLVITDQGNFYISISAGQISLSGKTYFAISPASPIGKSLNGLKEKDSFKFNQKQYTILQIV
jgi:transcription elongation GreA/GreB family factor